MKIRHALMSLGVASALAAAPAFAQTAIVVDPSVRVDPNAPVVIVTPDNAYVVTPDNSMSGMHYEQDRFGHRILWTTATARRRRHAAASSTRPWTASPGTVTSPGYMGPRDTSGQ
jgi:S-adenosylmethionine hydrolase